jgi:hypothetical protein
MVSDLPITSTLNLMRTRLKTLLYVLLLSAPAAVGAQFAPDPIQYVITPEVPGPNQTVTIEAQGIGAFLGDASITWQKDGKTVQAGAGLRTYSFITGGIGSVTQVRVDIKSSTNGSFSKTFVFRPSAVNLIWEADTSAPPLFAGKPLYSAGSAVKVAAFPTVVINGSRVASQSLSYQWTRQDQALPAQSGLGRNTLQFDGDQLQPEEDIGVGVYFGSSLVAQGAIAIPASQTQLKLYERNALRGVLYDAALPQGIALSDKEITIAAQPYYFSNQSLKAGTLQYAWALDGNEITGPDSGRGILTLRQTGSGSGQSTLTATLQNNMQDQLVQSAQTLITILFGGQAASGSLFGL